MGSQKNQEIALLWKFLDGTITEEESYALAAYLKSGAAEKDPEFEKVLQQLYLQSSNAVPMSAEAAKRVLQRLLKSIQQQLSEKYPAPVHRVHLLNRAWFRYAAVAVLVLSGSVLAWLLISRDHKKESKLPVVATTSNPSGSDKAVLQLADGKTILLDSNDRQILHIGDLSVNNQNGKLEYDGVSNKVEWHTLSTPRGGQYNLRLPDGTEVWLNAASSITFPNSFATGERKVKISGEAYFEVAQKKDQPFKVDIDGKATVEVLGTHFNINAYTDEPYIATTLTEGAIKMINRQQTAILSPGQQARINTKGMNVLKDADTDLVLAWKNGLFRFENSPINDVLRQFARWYDVEVVIEQNDPDILFTGEVNRNLTLLQAMIVLEKMGVHFTLKERRLTIKP
ncbi:FecR family protein [Pseudoflavitalea rhizosphaerae]|uniref:FecR family protein n=1 Tax=Pseudoflavitalea rhizosphaerae TaxID=1884793 RepID=UPI000F8CACF3|nr:FecR family protein [Pseudoflavitalea rhizosphaerae]